MKVRFKKLDKNAITPIKAHLTDAGYDLSAISVYFNICKRYYEYETGISFKIPEGYVGLVFPRSSISKTKMSLCNSVGVIDSHYRGTIRFRFYGGDFQTKYKIGDKIGQIIIIPIPNVELEESDELSETDRGIKGFGSSGS